MTFIEQALADPDVRKRTMATIALIDMEGEKALPFLEKALADPDAGVRRRALDSLWRIGGEQERDLLLGRLALEEDRLLINRIRRVLERNFAGDPVVDEALDNFYLPEETPARKPRPEEVMF